MFLALLLSIDNLTSLWSIDNSGRKKALQRLIVQGHQNVGMSFALKLAKWLIIEIKGAVLSLRTYP